MATEINKLVVPIPDGQGGYVNEEITFEGSGGGSGLPNEVITYDQFRAKTDAQQAAYTGYVTGWTGGALDTEAWTSPVSVSVGATSVTVSNSAITTSSIIDYYCQNVSGKPIKVTSCAVTAGQAVLSFGALTESTNFILHVVNL